MRRLELFLLVGLLLAVPRRAMPQAGVPLGPEFRVNTFTSENQRSPGVAVDPAGSGFVVVWQSYGQDGSEGGIFGQRYAASGAPLGPEFRVNTYTPSRQYYPSVAASAGRFVVTWMSRDQDGSSEGVFGQRYDFSSGTALGPEFRINTTTGGNQGFPAVASDASGNFVVAWEGVGGSGGGIFGQRFANDGTPLGPEFRANTFTAGAHFQKAVGSDGTGNFIVVWMSVGQDGSSGGVYGQRFLSSGFPIDPEFRVNAYTTGSQSTPATFPRFLSAPVVFYQSEELDGSGEGVFGQRYENTGVPLGQAFRVNTYTSSGQAVPKAAMDSSGNFVVVWESLLQDGSYFGIFGQRYDASATALGPEFRVNTYTSSSQFIPSVAADPSGSFVVVWHSLLQDGSGFGIFGQRFGPILPVELMHFGVE